MSNESALPANRVAALEKAVEHCRGVVVLLNLIIPASVDGKMPAAADLDGFEELYDEHLSPWIKDSLQLIDNESRVRFGRAFWLVSPSEQLEIVNSLRSRLFEFFNRFVREVVQRYYQHDLVLQALGLEARSPFPGGHSVEPGDLTLLEPVWDRQKLYRDLNP